ncbi:hypothetical protein BGW80DRAFT_1463459 [Lactifluus volemus]|nr:hypothetical protein BGW80DRAFT_1463459 [Lactifluus volemus]
MSVQLQSQTDTAPPAAAPPSTVPSQPVAVPADATAQVSFFRQAEILDTAAALAPLQYGDLAVLGLAGWSPASLSSWMLELVNDSSLLP